MKGPRVTKRAGTSALREAHVHKETSGTTPMARGEQARAACHKGRQHIRAARQGGDALIEGLSVDDDVALALAQPHLRLGRSMSPVFGPV